MYVPFWIETMSQDLRERRLLEPKNWQGTTSTLPLSVKLGSPRKDKCLKQGVDTPSFGRGKPRTRT